MPAMDENVIKRIMPHSLEAEQSVIGSMFIDAEAIAAATEQISGEDFYNRQYGVVFDTIVELNNEGKPIDFVTLQDRLRSKEDVPPEVSGLDFLTNLIAAVPTSANIKYYAGIVAEKATLRRLIRTNEEIANTCYSGKESLDTILESTESKINEVVQKKNVKEFVPIRTVVMNAMDKIEKASKLHGTVTGIATGFIDLDYRTAGMQPSDLVLIAARPSMGKTAFVLNIAQHVAFKQNLPVAIFSLEMSKEQLINRMFSLESSVDAQKLRTGQLNDQEWERLIESAGVIGKSKLMIDDTPGISIAELRSKSKTYAATAHNLQACRTYKSVWLEYTSKPLAQKDTFYKQKETALQAYSRAASQLDKMGISLGTEPEKVRQLVTETESRIADLIAELEIVCKTNQAIQEDKEKVEQIQSG